MTVQRMLVDTRQKDNSVAGGCIVENLLGIGEPVGIDEMFSCQTAGAAQLHGQAQCGCGHQSMLALEYGLIEHWIHRVD